MTPQEHLKAAWSALLKGDLAERDRRCDLAKKAIDEEDRLRRIPASDIVSKN